MPETNNIIPVDIIEDGTDVTITVTNVLYKRIQDLIFHGLPFKDMKHFLEVCKQVQANDVKTDPLARHLETCLMISASFEQAAKAQGKISKKAYDTVNKKVVEST